MDTEPSGKINRPNLTGHILVFRTRRGCASPETFDLLLIAATGGGMTRK
jgi:hypothetical protein